MRRLVITLAAVSTIIVGCEFSATDASSQQVQNGMKCVRAHDEVLEELGETETVCDEWVPKEDE